MTRSGPRSRRHQRWRTAPRLRAAAEWSTSSAPCFEALTPLLSDEASFLTGGHYLIDGGLSK